MNIEQLDNKTLKLVLSKKDMDEFNITYDELDYSNKSTKAIISSILDNVKLQTGLELAKGKLFIEAFPYADGGCVMYINMLLNDDADKKKVGKKSFDTPMIYKISSAATLFSLCKGLNRYFSHILLKSSLYKYENEYYLFLYTYCKMEDALSRFILEYGKLYAKGGIIAAMLKEHGDMLIEENAIARVEELLS